MLLLLSIVLNAYLILSFKVVERFRIPLFQAILFNYITCVITGTLFSGAFKVNAAAVWQPWFGWALLMGTLFVSIFNLIGFTAQRIGVSVASVVTKLSLIIPFLFSLYLYREPAGPVKIGGIVLALLAVVLTCLPQQGAAERKPGALKPFFRVFIPVVLFLSSGMLDTLVKYVEQRYLNESNDDAYLIASFAAAATIGAVVLAVLLLTGRQKFHPASIIAGIAIGVPNYFSIWSLVQVLKQAPGNSSAVIPVNNMGIVLVSAVGAFFFFGEKLSGTNWLGILLSLAAIALIAFG